ncbi:MAG TPA: enoyl-CoA hydratase/isomerase family protein, partial [Jatrophihabitans sp.]|nr:enoyl-CoA hydratase/isomerase family protein [Jatrophihabitans sp.]
MAANAPVLTEELGEQLAVVRLNRPQRRNALDSEALALLNETLDELAGREALRAVVLSTTDVRALCAGADVAEALDEAGG